MDNSTPTQQSLSPHRQKKRDRMIEKILDTARSIMREQGVAALSMQELSRRLDMRAPSLYNYFSSKMDLYDALFRLGFLLLDEQARQTRQKAQTWQNYIHGVFIAYMTFAQQNPELYQLCFERPVPGFVPSEESMKISYGMLNAGYQDAEKFLASLDTDLTPQQMTDLMIALMHGLTAMHMANEPELPLGEGRFGSLIPAALSLLEKAWSKPGA